MKMSTARGIGKPGQEYIPEPRPSIVARRLSAFGSGYMLVRDVDKETGENCLKRVVISS